LLEGTGHVALSKEHYQWFEEPEGRFEGCFPLIAFFDADIMVSPSDVKFGEEDVSIKVTSECLDIRKWVDIPYGPCIQCAVVLYGSECPIFLLDEEEGCSIG